MWAERNKSSWNNFNSGSIMRGLTHDNIGKMTEIYHIQLWILYLSEYTPWTRLVHWRPTKEALYPTRIQRPVCLSAFRSGKGSVSIFQLFSFPFVKPVIRAQLHGKLFGRSTGRKEKQNRTWLFTFVLISHRILIALSLHILSRRSSCRYSYLFHSALSEIQVLEWMIIVP